MENIYPPGIESYACGVCCQKENIKINSCSDCFCPLQCAFRNIWHNQILPLCSWEKEEDVLSLYSLQQRLKLFMNTALRLMTHNVLGNRMEGEIIPEGCLCAWDTAVHWEQAISCSNTVRAHSSQYRVA